MPSAIHEAPLVVLREEPALVPALLREVLGVAVPAFTAVDVADAGFTQVVPAELRADLVVHLRGGPPERAVVMGIVVEIQRARDDAKRHSWPIYVAALHARLRCQTSLIVLATDDATARWAATPITTLQLGSPFVPLVLGPDRIPRVSLERALREPWMAVLSALVHGNRAGGTAATIAALEALPGLPKDQAILCYDLITASLNEVARRALEAQMQPGKYEYQSDFARHHFREGEAKGRQEGIDATRRWVFSLADRHGLVRDELRGRVNACAALEELHALALGLAGAADLAAVEALLARLPAAPA